MRFSVLLAASAASLVAAENGPEATSVAEALISYVQAVEDSPAYTSYTAAIAAALPTTYDFSSLAHQVAIPAVTNAASASAQLDQLVSDPAAFVSAEPTPAYVSDLPAAFVSTVYLPFQESVATAIGSILSPLVNSGAPGGISGSGAMTALCVGAVGSFVGFIALFL